MALPLTGPGGEICIRLEESSVIKGGRFGGTGFLVSHCSVGASQKP